MVEEETLDFGGGDLVTFDFDEFLCGLNVSRWYLNEYRCR